MPPGERRAVHSRRRRDSVAALRPRAQGRQARPAPIPDRKVDDRRRHQRRDISREALPPLCRLLRRPQLAAHPDAAGAAGSARGAPAVESARRAAAQEPQHAHACLLYTSDAADDM
eukprot:808707-Prymnesium_polylepis.1